MKNRIYRLSVFSLFFTAAWGCGAIAHGEGGPRDAALSNETLKTIHERKSVRHFIDKPVSREQLLTLVKAAMAAPTAVNKQPWAFVVVTDRDELNHLADLLPYAKMTAQAQAAVIICGDLNLALPDEMQQYWIQDCSAATENLLLAAESLGLGAVWTGVYPIEDRMLALRRALNLPDTIIPLNLIPIGYPTGEDKPKDKYNPDRVHWEKW